MKTYYGRTGFMDSLLKTNPNVVLDAVKGIKTTRDQVDFRGGKRSETFLLGLEDEAGFGQTRAKTLELMRRVVKDTSYTLVFEHNHYELTKTQCGMQLCASSPLKIADVVSKQLMVNTFVGIAFLFGFQPTNHKTPRKWKEVEGYRIDLAFGDMELCVEIGGPKYYASEVSWAQVERNNETLALVATTVASVENILDNYIDYMINRTKEHFEKNA